MKIKIVKAAFATAGVVAVGVSCFKAYNASNQSESSMLLAENVEALTAGDPAGAVITVGGWRMLRPIGKGLWEWIKKAKIWKAGKQVTKEIVVQAAADATVEALESIWNSQNPDEQLVKTVTRFVPTGDVKDELVEKCHGYWVLEHKIAKVCQWEEATSSDCLIIGQTIWETVSF